MNRQELEQVAQQVICACQHYELADNMDNTTDDELLTIINNHGTCDSACDE